MIYRSIITSKFRTENLVNFYKLVGDAPDKHSIYVTFGRSEKWSDSENDPGFAPPYPLDNFDGVVDMWTNMMGAAKVNREMLDAVYPRKDYGDVRFDNPYTFFIGDVVVVNSTAHNRTDPSRGWMVYRVVDVPDVGECSIKPDNPLNKEECHALGGKWTPTNPSSSEPIGEGDAIETQDGYVWEYLYTIPIDVAINRCTNEHIVVPFADQLYAEKDKWGYENVLEWYPSSSDLLYRMKVNTLRFRAYMDSLYFPETLLANQNTFRQISIMMNPLKKKANPIDPDVKMNLPYTTPDQLEPHSGEMIYMENRPPVTRTPDQLEEISIIFEF
ncbi:baseplate wedge subunit [Cronobacter phage LPCS28]|uniref:Bacteriophage T4 Gp8 domain-containing protein n=1 Tax=Cronobacter phage LPCS28 TaxID=2924885 RepID=A0AAE9G4Z4_9CAUD|nr:baseplate wedge subunit [Cronobacter phage LPCS28]UNY47140.1 hypothetical protein EHEKIMEA_00258 [Cronobacter phage LPCS28]